MSLHDELWAALNLLPKPVTEQAILERAAQILPPKETNGFKDWMKVNAAYLVGRLNA